MWNYPGWLESVHGNNALDNNFNRWCNQSSTHAFSHYHNVINITYNSLTSVQRFLTFSFTGQRERKAMKDESTHHGTMVDRNNRSVFVHWYSVLWEKLAISSLWLAGRQAGRQNIGGSQKKSLQVKLFGLIFCLILL